MFKYHKLLFFFAAAVHMLIFYTCFSNSRLKSVLELMFIVICLADSKEILSCPSLKESSSLRNSRGRNEASTSKAFRTAVAGSPKHKGKHFLWILFRVFTPYWSSKLN